MVLYLLNLVIFIYMSSVLLIKKSRFARIVIDLRECRKFNELYVYFQLFFLCSLLIMSKRVYLNGSLKRKLKTTR